MKRLLPFLLFATTFWGFAQEKVGKWHFAVENGVSWHKIPLNYNDRPFVRNTFERAWQLPAPYFKYQIWDNLFLETGLAFVPKVQGVYRTNYLDSLKVVLRRNYLQVPIGARATFFNGVIRGFVSSGLYMGYWVSGRWDAVTYNLGPNALDPFTFSQTTKGKYIFDKSFDIDNRKDNRFEIGGYVGLGVQAHIKREIYWIEFRVAQAFSQLDRYKKGKTPIDHQPMRHFGYFFTFGVAEELPFSFMKSKKVAN